MLTTALLAIFIATPSALADRVPVCHLKGNGDYVQIEINANALAAHYAKGAIDPIILFEDADGDGYGNPLISIDTCEASFAGYVDNADDLDDTNPLISDYDQWTDPCVGDECTGGEEEEE